MDKKYKQAIQILEEQIESLEHIGSLNNGTWKTETLSQIGNFFSKELEEYTYFKSLELYVPEYNASGKLSFEERQRILSERKTTAMVFLSNCIRTIQRRGIYRKPKRNLISNISEDWLIFISGLIVASMIGLFYIGYWYGQHYDKSSFTEFTTDDKPQKTTNNTHDSTKKK